METYVTVQGTTKAEIYEEIIPQIASLLEGESDLVANLANIAAVLKMSFPYVSWVGFYIAKGDELVLGPFQGKPACVRIAIGKGVCGSAAERKETIIGSNVHEFPGHIFCDPDSKSEIVVPIVRNGKILAVLDLDSNQLSMFDQVDNICLSRITKLLVPYF